MSAVVSICASKKESVQFQDQSLRSGEGCWNLVRLGSLQAYRCFLVVAKADDADGDGKYAIGSLPITREVLLNGEVCDDVSPWCTFPFAPTADAMLASVNSILSSRCRAWVSSSDLRSDLDASPGRL